MYKKMQKFTHTRIVLAGLVCSLICGFGAYADNNSNLTTAIQNAKSACLGISDRMSNMKTMAGINTAVTGVGTVTGGVALGAGVMKNKVDNVIEEWESALNKMIKKQEQEGIEFFRIDLADFDKSYDRKIKSVDAMQSDINKATEVSKNLGNIRTGTLATSTVMDTAGTIIALNNRVDEDLQETIDKCISAVDALDSERGRARAENTATESELLMAEKVVSNCSDWKNVDLSSINGRATGAAVSSGVGAVLGLAGTITSAKANSDSVRNDNSDDGKQTEKNLNTASNVLAGGTTVASLTSTIFNATQISAIKKAVVAADKCEEALR